MRLEVDGVHLKFVSEGATVSLFMFFLEYWKSSFRG